MEGDEQNFDDLRILSVLRTLCLMGNQQMLLGNTVDPETIRDAPGFEFMLNMAIGHQRWGAAIPDLFRDAFAAAEGADEGQVIRDLVQKLMTTTPENDLFSYVAFEGQTVLGCIFFSRLMYD